jgi:hypothetical protein
MDYAAYIASEHWLDVKRRYRASRLPQCCLVCGCKSVDLHHRTYKRFGREHLTDLVPLCRDHHDECHRVIKRRRHGLRGGTKQYIRKKRKDKMKDGGRRFKVTAVPLG